MKRRAFLRAIVAVPLAAVAAPRLHVRFRTVRGFDLASGPGWTTVVRWAYVGDGRAWRILELDPWQEEYLEYLRLQHGRRHASGSR